MTSQRAAGDAELLHPYVDGELDAASSLALERKIAEDPALAAEHARLVSLRRNLGRALAGETTPESLRARVLALTEAPAAQAPVSRAAPKQRWLALATAAGIAFMIGGGATWLARPPASDPIPVEVVAGHVRSLLAREPVDVSSSDRHTVRPWFSGRLPMSPVVRDLTRQGFPLVGGRVDYVGRQTVAALVYRHRQHLISLYAWPASARDAGPRHLGLDGYALLTWTEGSVAYWAVSDLDPDSLETFRKLLAETPPDPD